VYSFSLKNFSTIFIKDPPSNNIISAILYSILNAKTITIYNGILALSMFYFPASDSHCLTRNIRKAHDEKRGGEWAVYRLSRSFHDQGCIAALEGTYFSRKNRVPDGGIVFRASRSFRSEGCGGGFCSREVHSLRAGRCNAASVLPFPLATPIFRGHPGRKGVQNGEHVLQQSGWPWCWLRPSHTIDLQCPIFRKTGTGGKFDATLVALNANTAFVDTATVIDSGATFTLTATGGALKLVDLQLALRNELVIDGCDPVRAKQSIGRMRNE
jgi:hypothetical protein